MQSSYDRALAAVLEFEGGGGFTCGAPKNNLGGWLLT